ncbi:interleukin-17 receptor C isoform X1 [Sebastes fasciatus]|uniref:interleukin-17 receptor C isoform X1 n=2 Tax=Sebastes fasciatus TaxID=394691 RepID=UPI003D9E86B6
MFFPGWSIWCVLLTLRMSVCSLEIIGYDSHEVICLQGLSDCTMKDEMFIEAEDNAVGVQNLTIHFKLCCRDGEPCTLCLMIDMEINPSQKAPVTVCYSTPGTMASCKKVEFTVNHTALTHKNKAKFSMVITKPAGVSFGSQVLVYYSKLSHPDRKIDAPSLDEVCSLELQARVEECHVANFSTVINQEMNRVELQFADTDKSPPSVCVQYEQNGICESWNRTPIPLYAVTSCMCLQVWNEDEHRRVRKCPFNNTESRWQMAVWQNVSVSVGQGQMNNHRTMLSWNVSAPCRLEGEVWPCHKDISCREMKGFRQLLTNGTWKQNRKEQWEITGVFEEINLQLSPCVMVKVKGMGHALGPFCFKNTDRWRWSLLVVAVMLLVCLTVLLFYLLHDFIKKWVWSCYHGGFIKIVRKGHVVVLSPPDVDDGFSESCRLGSQLHDQGFSVSVDQCSTKKQCDLGPLPWLHSQLLELKSVGGRVVLVLTRKSSERVAEWARRDKEVIKTKGEDEICSPYSDVFMASLCLIQADKQQGRAGERFLLVTFDSHLSSDKSLPELFQGLPLFQLPSQTQALISELTVGRTARGSGRGTWTGWKWREKTKEGPDQQKAPHCKYVGLEKNWEMKPLMYP